MDNSKARRAPLHLKDTLTQTFGCRHSNPDTCVKNAIPSICAFVREDEMCLSPPKSWPKQYKKLSDEAGGTQDEAGTA
ncbi:MAG: hypothetical protein GY762_08065 [Proteobacteria bacterium]|nr:hypothetical protein [Pseudomonadota bacterium]